MTVTLSRTVEVVLTEVRLLASLPTSVDQAIATFESLQRRLGPPADEDRALGALRSQLASHLLALRAVRDAEASPASVARLVQRAVADVESRLGTTAAAR